MTTRGTEVAAKVSPGGKLQPVHLANQSVCTTQAEPRLRREGQGPGRANVDNSQGVDTATEVPLDPQMLCSMKRLKQSLLLPPLPHQELLSEDHAAWSFIH